MNGCFHCLWAACLAAQNFLLPPTQTSNKIAFQTRLLILSQVQFICDTLHLVLEAIRPNASLNTRLNWMWKFGNHNILQGGISSLQCITGVLSGPNCGRKSIGVNLTVSSRKERLRWLDLHVLNWLVLSGGLNVCCHVLKADSDLSYLRNPVQVPAMLIHCISLRNVTKGN